MTDIVKVKPQKSYDWNQDLKTVYIRINIPNTTINKIQIFLSDLVLRVTSLQKRSTHVFDLYDVVNYKSKQNKNIYANGVLQITLIKQKPQIWKDLNISLPIQQLRERRKQSQARYQKTIHEIEKKKQTLRDQFDRKATQELMRFEDQERNILKQRKQKQKTEALKEVYNNINEQGKIVKKTQTNWEDKQRLALQLLNRQEQQQKNRYLQQKKQRVAIQNSQSKSMFTEEQVMNSEATILKNQQQFEEIPIRKAQNVALKFTEKVYPGVAARDTHVKEPPVPKNKAINKYDKNQQLQNRNPLWLKDKGDQFIKNKDYISAINAYDSAIKANDKFLAAYMNRAYCHLKIMNYDECIADGQSALSILKSSISEQNTKQNEKTIVKIELRKAVCISCKGNLDEGEVLFKSILDNYSSILSEEQKLQIEESNRQIVRRIESNRIKYQADLQYKKNNFQKSLELYQQANKIQKNQYALSNRALSFLKLNRNTQVVEQCNKALQLVQPLIEYATFNASNKTSNFEATKILVKIYLRKGAALKNLGKYQSALETVRQASNFDDTDKEIKKLIRQIEIELNKGTIKTLKQKAASFLKQNKIEEALEKYNECLKIIEPAEVLEYLAILQNRCVCYLKLGRFDDIISTAIRGLKIIHNHQNRIVSFDNTKILKQEKQRLSEFEVRLLVRRANAYSELGQIYNAKSDLQKAIKISPDNQSIKNDLQKISTSLQK